MSRSNNVETAKKNAVKTDQDTAQLSAQVSNRFARSVDMYVSENKDKLELDVNCTGEHEPLILTVRADIIRASVADMIHYTFEPWELKRKDSGDARRETNKQLKGQAALATKLMEMMKAMGMEDQLKALLAEQS